jgi:UDP-glucose:(heptosyl)LPS alpha-1,3-glucosyltransferase
MKEIVLLKSRFFQGAGLEKYARHIAKAFAGKGHPVTVLTTGESKETSLDPLIKTVFFEINKASSVQKVLSFDKSCEAYLQNTQAPVIFGLDRNRFQTHLRAGNGVHAAYLHHRARSEGWLKRLSFAVNPLHQLILRLEKEAFEHPGLQLLIVNSEMVRNEVLSYYAVDPRKIQVLHNGVEWSALEKDFATWPQSKAHFAHSLGLNPHLFHFLFIGHNFRRKGLDHLLQALALLKEKKFHLSVVGTDKQMGSYKKLTKQLHLQEKVTFFGPRSDVKSFYQLADAIVIPSLYDPFANVTVEALAMGVYAVSSKTNGGHEILKETTGSVIENLADPSCIVASLEKALRAPKTLQTAEQIRSSIRYLDYPEQLNRLINLC